MTTPKVEYLYNYKGQHGSVWATSPMAAQQSAGEHLDVPRQRQYMIAVKKKDVPVQVLPYMGKPGPSEAEIKRKHGKSAEAVGTGTHKTSNHIREFDE